MTQLGPLGGPLVALAASSAGSSTPGAASSSEAVLTVASEEEDALLQVVKRLEASAISAASSVTQGLRLFLPESASTPEDTAGARELVDEMFAVVDTMWLDARGTGFSHDAWQALYDAAMTQRPPRNTFEAHSVIRDLLARGPQDPYTRFLSPGEFRDMKSYDITGVGLNLGSGEDFVRKTGLALPAGREDERRSVFVIGLIKGKGADVVGVRQGDEVLRVNAVDVTQGSPFEAAALIAGPQAAASAVTGPVTVEVTVRHSNGEVEDLRMLRPNMAVENPVSWRLEQKGARRIGWIKLKSFNARAQPEIARAVSEATAAGADELVLDLLDNRGGLVNECVEIARLFLPDNSTVFVTQGKSALSRTRIERSTPVSNLPLIVLVNEHTASSSEILSGALHDNCRAVLAGSTTYGKGLIQSVFELKDSAGLVVTVGKYLTPNGTDIDRAGIQPDFRQLPSREAADAALRACRLRPPPALA